MGATRMSKKIISLSRLTSNLPCSVLTPGSRLRMKTWPISWRRLSIGLIPLKSAQVRALRRRNWFNCRGLALSKVRVIKTLSFWRSYKVWTCPTIITTWAKYKMTMTQITSSLETILPRPLLQTMSPSPTVSTAIKSTSTMVRSVTRAVSRTI